MKTTTIFCVLFLLLLYSCVATKINKSNKQNYSELKENKMYIIKINKFSMEKTVAVVIPPIIVIVALSNINTNTSGDFSIPWR